jgi:hypothetical protein
VLGVRGLVAWPRRLFVSAILRLRRVSSEIERRLRKRPTDQSDESVIGRSGLFDTDWYLAQNPDVAAAGINPLVHYLRHGAAEGRDPNPLFDTDWYLAQNPDVAAAGINPLVHYLRHGAAEGRDPIRAAAEFPEGLSFFRIARRHRLGYVMKTGMGLPRTLRAFGPFNPRNCSRAVNEVPKPRTVGASTSSSPSIADLTRRVAVLKACWRVAHPIAPSGVSS